MFIVILDADPNQEFTLTSTDLDEAYAEALTELGYSILERSSDPETFDVRV